jgi:hypothetical protein
VVICTDVDIAMTPNAWETMLAVESGQAIIPIYRRAHAFESRNDEPPRVDLGMTGTQSMVAGDWRRVQYHEGCVGYGADDGLLLREMQRQDISLVPTMRARGLPGNPFVYHIDHPGEPGDDNVPGEGRQGCYGREDGFNFDNFEANRRLA